MTLLSSISRVRVLKPPQTSARNVLHNDGQGRFEKVAGGSAVRQTARTGIRSRREHCYRDRCDSGHTALARTSISRLVGATNRHDERSLFGEPAGRIHL